MNRIVSPYDPPRARWYSPLLDLGQALRRRMWLDRFVRPAAIPTRGLLTGLLVPGLAFYARGEKLIGKAILIGCALLAAVFVVGLGYPIANIAFGLLLSAHVTSILFLLRPWMAEARYGFRIVFAIAVLMVVGGCIYSPLRNLLQEHVLMPMRTSERVLVVRRLASAHAVKRGEWIAYSLTSLSAGDAHQEGGAIQTQAGFGLGPVLAVAGDRLRFTPQTFTINGVAQTKLPRMPESGELVVSEKHWFVWPDLAISGHGNTSEAAISATMLQLATVSEDSFIGKPFKRWFGRRQLFP